MNKHKPSKNNMFFLFKNLPINIEQTGFIFDNGVKVIQTPIKLIENPLGNDKPQFPHEDIGLTCFINPFHYLDPTSLKNICLVAPDCINQTQSIWRILYILRLIKPLYIGVISQFVFDEKVINPGQHMHHSRLNKISFSNKGEREFYQFEDLEYVNKLLPKINKILSDQTKYPQLKQAIQQFFQATLGEKWHYASTGFQKLFPGIDCLFGNPKSNHRNKISFRINKFLSKDIKQGNAKITYLQKLFEILWDTERHKAAHGFPPPATTLKDSKPSNEENNKACFCVHELLRISLLKMLELDEKALDVHERNSGNYDESRNQKLDEFFQGILNSQSNKEKNNLMDQFLKDIL